MPETWHKSYTQQYAFTVTLKPNKYKFSPEVQYGLYDELIKILTKDGSQATLTAELTKNFNIHFHGVIKFPLHRYKCPDLHFVNMFRNSKQFGYVNIKPVTEEKGWVEYMRKDLKKTLEYISRRPIIRDDLLLFNTDEYTSYGTTW